MYFSVFSSVLTKWSLETEISEIKGKPLPGPNEGLANEEHTQGFARGPFEAIFEVSLYSASCQCL